MGVLRKVCDEMYNDIKNMNWGILTADMANGKTNTIVHILNHYISNDDSIDRTLRFAKGRIKWFDKYLMQAFNHEVVIDDLGQAISLEQKNRIKKELSAYVKSVVFSSER